MASQVLPFHSEYWFFVSGWELLQLCVGRVTKLATLHCIASSDLACMKPAVAHHDRSWHRLCTSGPCCSPSPYHPEY